MATRTAKTNINIKNKRASFDYELLDTWTAGLVLTGTEIKSIRESKASLADTYCTFINGELWVKGMHIAQYFYGSYNNHEAKRDRKLLLSKKELRKIASDSKNPGFTIVPTRLFINEKGLAKLVIALAKRWRALSRFRNSIPFCSQHHRMDGLQPALAVLYPFVGFHLREADLADLAYLLYLVNRCEYSAGAAVEYG